MAITNTVMVSQSSLMEYAVVVTHPTGVATIHHINKNFNLLSQDIHDLVDARSNSTASGRHYFVSEKKDANHPFEVSVVEIAANNPKETVKWEAKNFLEAYQDFHYAFRFHPGAVTRKIGYSTRPPTVSLESFIKFMSTAFPIDYQNWKLVDPNLIFTRQAFAIPTLP